MKSVLLRIAGMLVVLAAVTYAGDYLSVRYRIPSNRNPFGAVTVTPMYVIQEKNGKTEYDFAQPESQVCVRSLFPHLGYSPCWYVSRHTEPRIEI